MTENREAGNQTEQKNHLTSNVLTERLAQLGYHCLPVTCGQFTTLKLMPLETKRKEELLPPSGKDTV